jgi:hypothetical protein
MLVSFYIRALYGGVRRHKCPCCVSSNTFSFNCILMSELSIFVFLSREVLSQCSSTNCVVESTVTNFRTSLKTVISASFYCFHSGDGDDWSHSLCYAVSSGKLLLTFWRGVLCTSQCGVTSQKTWICVSSISIKSFFLITRILQCSGLKI